MTIQIEATCEVAKSFSVKREKRDDDTEAVIAHLKIADVMLDREQIDEVIGLPIGWAQSALFDDFGAPRAALTLKLAREDWTLTGTISGGDKPGSPALTLSDAQVSGITLDLTTLGALLSCGLAWVAAGDEVDDIADMLGKLCAFSVSLVDSGQRDLLADPAVKAARTLQRMVEAGGIESVELCDGNGKTLFKVEGKGKRRERAPA